MTTTLRRLLPGARGLAAAGLALLLALAPALADPPLRVGTAADQPPLTFLSGEDEWVGIESDLARTLAAQMGRALDYQVIPRDELIPALQAGRIDIAMSGLVADEELAGSALLTRSWLQVGQMLIIRTEDVMRFSTPMRVLAGGVRLGVVAGGRGERFAASTAVEPVPFEDSGAALDALVAGRVDAVLDDASSSWRLATERAYRTLMSLPQHLTEEHLVWAVAPGAEELRESVEGELMRMRQSGVLEHIFDRWIPVRVSP